jgi:hypothetical protein
MSRQMCEPQKNTLYDGAARAVAVNGGAGVSFRAWCSICRHPLHNCWQAATRILQNLSGAAARILKTSIGVFGKCWCSGHRVATGVGTSSPQACLYSRPRLTRAPGEETEKCVACIVASACGCTLWKCRQAVGQQSWPGRFVLSTALRTPASIFLSVAPQGGRLVDEEIA